MDPYERDNWPPVGQFNPGYNNGFQYPAEYSDMWRQPPSSAFRSIQPYYNPPALMPPMMQPQAMRQDLLMNNPGYPLYPSYSSYGEPGNGFYQPPIQPFPRFMDTPYQPMRPIADANGPQRFGNPMTPYNQRSTQDRNYSYTERVNAGSDLPNNVRRNRNPFLISSEDAEKAVEAVQKEEDSDGVQIIESIPLQRRHKRKIPLDVKVSKRDSDGQFSKPQSDDIVPKELKRGKRTAAAEATIKIHNTYRPFQYHREEAALINKITEAQEIEELEEGTQADPVEVPVEKKQKRRYKKRSGPTKKIVKSKTRATATALEESSMLTDEKLKEPAPQEIEEPSTCNHEHDKENVLDSNPTEALPSASSEVAEIVEEPECDDVPKLEDPHTALKPKKKIMPYTRIFPLVQLTRINLSQYRQNENHSYVLEPETNNDKGIQPEVPMEVEESVEPVPSTVAAPEPVEQLTYYLAGTSLNNSPASAVDDLPPLKTMGFPSPTFSECLDYSDSPLDGFNILKLFNSPSPPGTPHTTWSPNNLDFAPTTPEDGVNAVRMMAQIVDPVKCNAETEGQKSLKRKLNFQLSPRTVKKSSAFQDLLTFHEATMMQ